MDDKGVKMVLKNVNGWECGEHQENEDVKMVMENENVKKMKWMMRMQKW